MARAKRKSTILDTARLRLAGLKAITPPPDFGPNLQVTAYEQQVNDFGAKIDRYNGMLATLDDLQNEIESDENTLREMNRRMLSATEARYGSDSSEYEQAGGTRQSERKRSTKKAPSTG
jgi:hypothetical protein